MTIAQYRADGVTPLDGQVIGSFQAGGDSDVVRIVMKNEGAAERTSVPIVMRTEDPVSPGTGLAYGVAPQDEMWGRCRVAAFTAPPGDPSWTIELTDYLVMGAYAGMVIPRWPVDGIVELDFYGSPPASAKDAVAWGIYLVALGSDLSLPSPPDLSRIDRGILHGLGDGTVSYVLSGLDVEATGTPDDNVHTKAGFAVVHGHLVGVPDQAAVQLDQNDGSAEALQAGESYLVIRSLAVDGTITHVRGDRGADPDEPATPAGELRLPRVIRVEYQAGGTSVIEAADITTIETYPVYGRYFAEVDSATTLRVHPGRALGGGTRRFADAVQLVPVPDDDESWIFQLASGLFDDSQDPLLPPEDTAIGPFWRALAAGGAITELEDLRTYAGDLVVLHLRGTPAAVGELASQVVVPERLILENVIWRLSDNGGGSAGSTILDAHLDGTTIYTERTTDDQRPTFAFGATGAALTVRGRVHQVTELRTGQVLSIEGDEYPDTDTAFPAWVEAYFLCRRV